MSLTEQRTSTVSSALAKDRLGVPSVVFFVLSAAAPLMVVAGVVSTAWAATGVVGVPLAFILLGAVLGIFAVGYVTMARHVVNAGAFYAYTAQGLGRPAGVATAWVALLAYNTLQVGMYGVIGSAVQPLLSDWFGITTPWWLIALVAWALTGVLGLMRVDVNGTVLSVLLVSEIAVVLAIDAANLGHPAAAGLTFDALSPSHLFAPGVGAAIALCIAAFSGFESSVVFAEETKDPRRTVPIATYVALAIISLLYAVSSWAETIPVGAGKIVGEAQKQGPGLLFGLAGQNLGSTAGTIASVLFATSIMASLIAFHNTTSRYVFALGRESVLPAMFGRTSLSGAPVVGSITQTVIGFVVIVFYAALGRDPLVELFFTFGAFGGLGLLLLLAATSIAVVVFFGKNSRGETAWRTRIAPGIASVLLLVVLGLVLINFDTVLGVSPDSVLRWILPALYVITAVFGLLWGLGLRSRRPDVYANIGLGPRAAVGSQK